MGKHSSPEATPFLRSIVAWALPWLLIIGVVAIALLVALRMVEDDPVRASGPASDATTTSPEPDEEPDDEPSAEREPDDDDPPPEKTDAEKKDSKRDPTDQPAAPDLKAEGVAVQVLNGTGDAAADDLVADRLARLGYTVVAVSPAAKAYPRTVVFWVGGADEAARALAAKFDWESEAAPGNLSSEVDLHVVVGANAL